MSAVRRAYIYIACLAGLESVSWAAISLLRNLLVPGGPTSLETTAFRIAVIVIGLPIFVVHWLWAQRLARRRIEERGAVLRRLYLYGAMATFLGPFLANAFDLLRALMRLGLALRPDITRYLGLSQVDVAIHHLIAMALLAVLWAYHRHVAAADAKASPEQGAAVTVRRLYIYGFSAAGLTMTILAAVSLSRSLLLHVGGQIVTQSAAWTHEVARLAVGLPVWLIFWRWAERLFAAPDEEEHESVVRKVYLYLAVFLGVLATVTTLTILLADGLGTILGGSGSGGGDIREALAVLVWSALLWAYHARVLRRDASITGTPATTAWVGRLYRYLVAAIGLAAFLIGLAGNINLLIRAAAGVTPVGGVADQVAWFTAVMIAGLPVWLVPWRQLQLAATAPGPLGNEESASVIRKVYLYFYVLVATLTILGTGVYIVSRLISLALGVTLRGHLLTDIGQSIALSLVAVGIWLVHGAVLRADARRAAKLEMQRLSTLDVIVLDPGDGTLGRVLVDALQGELPGVRCNLLGLTPEASATLGTTIPPAEFPAAIAAADLIVGPWTVAIPIDEAHAGIAQAVAASPARKVLIPAQLAGWHWVGVGDMKTHDAIRHAVRAVKQAAAGEEIKTPRGLSAGAIVAIVFAALVLLLLIGIPLIGLAVEYMLY